MNIVDFITENYSELCFSIDDKLIASSFLEGGAVIDMSVEVCEGILIPAGLVIYLDVPFGSTEVVSRQDHFPSEVVSLKSILTTKDRRDDIASCFVYIVLSDEHGGSDKMVEDARMMIDHYTSKDSVVVSKKELFDIIYLALLAKI